jgi:hypothetical protein
MGGHVTRNEDFRYSAIYEEMTQVTVDLEGSGRRSQFREARPPGKSYVDAGLPARGTPL